ncbi:MAG: alpha/beta-type small acid-soluble spore protein [Oscillospiraceae bacterium]|nr:alpha/beta-type small acid-soluble spore protein [Oscillospiraceae bacterium]
MANNSNKLNIPEARDAMNRFKMESASEVGVNLKQGYNGDLTSRQAGSVGGQMVKNVLTVRLTKKACFERENRIVDGHKQTVRYIAGIAI